MPLAEKRRGERRQGLQLGEPESFLPTQNYTVRWLKEVELKYLPQCLAQIRHTENPTIVLNIIISKIITST